MRRIVLWFMSTLTVVVLLFGYHTSTSGPQPTQVVANAPVNPGAGVSKLHHRTTGSTRASGSSGGSAPAKKSTRARVVSGPVTQTQWGPVQVQIKVSGGRITQVGVPTYPNGNSRDAQINAYALPRLVQETLNAQSAQIQMISGATVTSGGYVQSLQGAIDQAGL